MLSRVSGVPLRVPRVFQGRHKKFEVVSGRFGASSEGFGEITTGFRGVTWVCVAFEWAQGAFGAISGRLR